MTVAMPDGGAGDGIRGLDRGSPSRPPGAAGPGRRLGSGAAGAGGFGG
ncbi:hypothetical protein OG943_15805 [Amycolatopsis sp. NBC_00345]